MKVETDESVFKLFYFINLVVCTPWLYTVWCLKCWRLRIG